MNEENDSYYVEIGEALDVRKDLLLSSKQIVHTLKSFKDYQKTREEKKKTIKELLKSMQEVKKLTITLQSKLPKTHPKLLKKNNKEKISENNTEEKFLEKLSNIEKRLQELE